MRFSRDVRVYLTGFFITNVGVGGFTLATGLAFFQQTQSASTFAYLVGVEYGVGFAGQFVGAAILDRLDVLKVALVANAVRALAVVAGGVTFLLAGADGPLIVVFLVSALIRPLYRSASFVLARLVCPPGQLGELNALRFGLIQVAQLTGLAVVSGLFAIVGPAVIIIVVGGLFALGTATLAVLRGTVADRRRVDHSPGDPTGAGSRGVLSEVRVLGRALVRTPGIWVHLGAGGLPVVIVSLATVLVAPVNQDLGGGSFGIAVLDGGASVGALGTILVVRRLRQVRPRLLFATCLLAAGGLGVLALAWNIVLAGVAFFLLGIAAALGSTTFDTLLQQRTDPGLLGRLSISQEFVISLTTLALVPLSGPLLAHFGLSWASLLYASTVCLYLLVLVIGTLVFGRRLFDEPVSSTPAQPIDTTGTAS